VVVWIGRESGGEERGGVDGVRGEGGEVGWQSERSHTDGEGLIGCVAVETRKQMKNRI